MFTGVYRLLVLSIVVSALAASAAAQERVILSADYGVGDRNRTDVTSQVQSMGEDRMLNFPVKPDALGIADPAYGSVKELWIRVREPNGRVDVFRYRDGQNVELRLDAYGMYQGVLAPEWQARFDSYFTRWQENKRRHDRDEVESMEKRMRDIMYHYQIPGDTPFEYIASAQVAPRPSWRGLRLQQASYGAGDRVSDVTDRLQDLVQNNALEFRVDNRAIGVDPAPGMRKQLVVVYFYRGQRREVSAFEGEYLRIP